MDLVVLIIAVIVCLLGFIVPIEFVEPWAWNDKSDQPTFAGICLIAISILSVLVISIITLRYIWGVAGRLVIE